MRRYSSVRGEWPAPTPATKPRVPVEVKLTVRDAFGRQAFYSTTWQLIESGPGERGFTLSTGFTHVDAGGVRGEVEIRLGI